MENGIEQINTLKDTVVMYVLTRGVSIVLAIAIVALGFWGGKTVARLILSICERKKVDITLARFFAGLAKIIIIAFSIMIGLSKVGTDITPLVALLGASALGLSLAVQGPISNYGSGIVLIITRPFAVGDTLTVSGQTGIVDYVKLGCTELINEDEERITIPNRKVLGEIFTNSQTFKAVEAEVGISYDADPEEAIRCITEAIQAIPDIAPERAPDVGIDAFGDSSINIGYRVWVPTNRYHAKRFEINLAVYKALKSAAITIPFPQRDVRLIPTKSEV